MLSSDASKPVTRRACRPNVTTGLASRVEALLRAQAGPVSRNELLRALARSERAVTRAHLNAALAFLDRYGVIHDGGFAGVVWLGQPSLAVLERLTRARPLARNVAVPARAVYRGATRNLGGSSQVERQRGHFCNAR